MTATSREPPLELTVVDDSLLTCEEGHGPWSPVSLSETLDQISRSIDACRSERKGLLFWKKHLCVHCERPIRDTEPKPDPRAVSTKTTLRRFGEIEIELTGPAVNGSRCGRMQVLSTGSCEHAVGKMTAEIFGSTVKTRIE